MQSAAAAAPSALPHSVFPKDYRPLPCLLLTSLLLLLTLHLLSSPSSPAPSPPPPQPRLAPLPSAASAGPAPPSLAFLLTGSAGDADRLQRLLLATYHPRNVYLLLLDRAASADDRARLARSARAAPGRENVHVVGDPGFANPRGASALAATLHGAALLLKVDQGWDWFVHLDANEYPLVTPDDLLHVFSYLPKDLNFIRHTSYIGWKEERQIRPIIVDPGLYLSSRNDIFYATQKRDLPNAYKLFTGSSSVILSRKFIEYCIVGMDNLPRTLLMYYTNMPLPHRKYFQTVLCNSPEFNKTVVNHDLHYSTWDAHSKNEPRLLTIDDAENMTDSGAAFGTRFLKDDHVLDHIDAEILHRLPGEPVTGGWCIGVGNDSPCDISGNPDVLRPGPKAIELAKFLAERLSYQNFYGDQCIWD